MCLKTRRIRMQGNITYTHVPTKNVNRTRVSNTQNQLIFSFLFLSFSTITVQRVHK